MRSPGKSNATFRGAMWVAICGATLIGGTAPAHAQETAPEFDPFNFAFASYAGSGYYTVDGRQTLVLGGTPSWRIRKLEGDRLYGLTLRFGFTLGWYDLKTEDIIDFGFPGRASTLTFLPGLEVPIKMTENWWLAPFGDFGVAYSSETDDLTYVAGIGVRSRALFPTSRVDYVLWNRLLWARNSSESVVTDNQFTQLRTELDIRRLAVHHIKQRAYDWALYVQNDYYPKALEIQRVIEDVLRINTRWQVGFTWGPLDEWRPWWKVKVPRIGLAYIFGNGDNGYRFIIRFRY